jgi:nucleoside-diphosphate-sugar epimerase
MRVMVTGGTGFLGGHAVRALVDAGHEPRLLVRSQEKLGELIELFGLPPDIEWVRGDILDAASVAQALDGADACIHAAAFTTLDPALMDRCLEVNGPGTRIVLDAAVAAGCDPVLHTSSISCIFPPVGNVFDADDPVRSSEVPYSRSKAESDRYARELQAAGHPVVIVYPGGVTGPDDLGFNVMSAITAGLLASDTLMTGATGGGGAIDVRDLATAIARLMQPGGGPRRLLAMGHMLGWDDLNALMNEVTGLQRTNVRMTRAEMLDAIKEEEAVDLMLGFKPGNDAPILRATGMEWRPMRETYHDMIAWLLAQGYLEPRWAPAIAAAEAT